MKKFLAILAILAITAFPVYAENQTNGDKIKSEKTASVCKCKKHNKKDKVIKNKLFKIVIPKEITSNYQVKKTKNSISLYDKPSRKAGFGGFAFTIKAFQDPSEYDDYPGYRKIGELTDKKNNLYDIVLIQPTDVQYDYTKGENKDYLQLFHFGKKVEVQGINGSVYSKVKKSKN
ncbi:MAG: hypothetical protein K6C94_04765 [Candidatus Gastranaerophilales bacterium]|nr:hypothetical protein [Candidatus Gastranaerophilales bacterium]